MLTVTCPRCKETWEVPSSLAGQEKSCPACSCSFGGPRTEVDRLAEAVIDESRCAEERAVPAAPVPRVRHGMKRCNCGREIDANCTKCPRCGKVSFSPWLLLFLFLFFALGGGAFLGC
jgi:hypothetical protein